MRIKNSVINVAISMISQLITVLLGFITQKVFIQMLGTEILGINGLFTNIISMLAIAELGIGTAVIYNLYKPLADNNEEEINKWMKFYKKCYKRIAITISVLGMLLMPFISFFVGEININYNVYILYLLFLIDTVVSYLWTYKRSILYADQKNYVISIIHVIYLVLLNILQIVILILTNNYALYLIVKIIMRVVENLLINIATIKRYPYVKDKCVIELENKKQKKFYTELKGLVLHKISWIIIGGTDNIIIAKFVGIDWVGIYSNYLMITNTIEQFVAQMFSAITGSVGNLLTSETAEKSYKIYKRMSLMQFIIYSTAAVGIYCVSKVFIQIWLQNENFILSEVVTLFISLSFFYCGMRRNICVFKDAAGIFFEDRKMAIIAAIFNIIASIILARYFGIIGVMIGTILCYLFLHIFSYPKYIYARIFKRNKKEYILELFKYSIILFIQIVITSLAIKSTYNPNLFIEFIKNAILTIIITNVITILVFRKTEEYCYWRDFFKELINKTIKRKRRDNK